MVKLYGVARSRASRNLWLLGEIGMAYEHVPVVQSYRLADPMAADAPLNTASPAFVKMCPASAVPALDDDGLVLAESVAINLYLAKAYGGLLGPSDDKEAALMTQWGLYGITTIEAPALVILYAHGDGRAKTPDGQVDIAVAREKLRRPLAVLEGHLAAHGFMVGGRFTVADINMAEMVRYAQVEKKLLAEFPAVNSWLMGLQKRAAFMAMWALRMAEAE